MSISQISADGMGALETGKGKGRNAPGKKAGFLLLRTISNFTYEMAKNQG